MIYLVFLSYSILDMGDNIRDLVVNKPGFLKKRILALIGLMF